jgi:excisionase family DNA binding protein
MDTLLTTRQLQEILQVDRITIYRMLDDGRLSGFKVGGQWRFRRQAIEEWLQGQKSASEMPRPENVSRTTPTRTTALPMSSIRILQEVFAEALGVGTVVTAVDGTLLTSMSNACPFCTSLLGTPEGHRRCTGSWQAAATRSNRVPQPTACHAGLCYISGQIVVEDKFVAVAHAGQFLDRAPTGGAWSARIRELATATGLGPEQLQNTLACVPVFDPEMQQRIARLWRRIAGVFSDLGKERASLLERLEQIAQISQL